MNVEPTPSLDDAAPAAPLAAPVLSADGGGAIHWTWGGPGVAQWRLERFFSGVWSIATFYPGKTTSATGVQTGVPTRIAGINNTGSRVTGYSNNVTPS